VGFGPPPGEIFGPSSGEVFDPPAGEGSVAK